MHLRDTLQELAAVYDRDQPEDRARLARYRELRKNHGIVASWVLSGPAGAGHV